MVNTRKIPDIDIAIVGMSSLFPEARTLGEFWENILSRKNCIREIVDKNLEEFDGYWRLDEYYSADTTAIDKTYGKIGGFIPEIEFDPIEYGIPPIHLESISTIQLFSLVLAKEALADANYSRQDSHQSLNRERTGVILGVGGCGNIAFTLATRTNIPQWEKVLRNLGYPDELVEVTLKKLTSLYAGWRESSFPGLLGNVVSGRISSYFDLGGTNCTLDAACASSLAAIKMAMAELADGSCDAVLTGGVNVDNSILAYMCFSKTPALSQEGFSRPFDATSDGIVLGDGIGMLVLKRLADAEAQGDKIYGVIRGIGSSSDGRAKSIYAPRFEGQIKALNRAYERAQVNPKEIQLIEAHGTGTIAGDLCEIKSISAVYQAEKVPNSSVAIGSIKSQIGHTRIAAGAASLIKVALGLYHKILPPTINVTKPHPQLSLDNSCFYINNEARPWIQPADGSKRRAGVSAFGFGGTNYHLIVEEYAREHQSAYRIHQLPEIFIVRADNLKILSQTCEVLAKKFSGDEGENHYRQYCNDHRHQPIPRQAARLGFVSESVEQAVEYLNIAVTLLSGDIPEAGQHPKGIYYRDGGLDPSGKVVALFPGQGSQYLNMGKDWANNYPDMREVIGECDHLFKQRNRPLLSQVIYPPTVFDQEGLDLLQKQLTKTENAQPAIGAISAGVYRILQKAGFQPDFILGHSFGEFTALWAGGVLNDRAFLELAIERGQAMQLSSQGAGAEGRMLAVNADEKGVQKWLASFPDVSITNYNSSNQTVLGGSEASIISLQKELSQAGFKATILPVANAFHTRFVDYAAQPLAGKIFQIEFGQPSVAIYSNVTARPYPHQPEAIKKILADHLRSPVAFRQSVEAIYSQGGRIFVEIGPKNILTNFVKDILKNKEHIAVALDFQSSKTQEYELRRAIVQLMVAGMAMEKFDPYQLPHQVKARKAKPSLSIKLNGGFYLNPDTKELRQKNLVEKDTLVWDSFLKSHREASFSSLDLAHQPQLVSGQEDFSGQYNEPEKELLTTDTKEVFFSPVPVGNSTKTETFANYQDKTMQNKGSQSITTMNNTTTLDRPLENMNILNDRVESQNFLSAVHQQFYQTQNQYLDLLSKIIEHQNTLSEKYKDTEVLHQGMQNFDRMLQLLQTNLQYVNDNHKYYLQSQLALLQGATIPVPTTPSFPSLQEINSTTTIPASGSEIDGKPNQELEVAKENINESPSLTPEPTIAPAPVKALELLVITPSSSKSPAAKKPTETTPENGEKAADSLQVTITNSVPSQSESVSFVATLTTDRVTSGITPIVEPVTIQVVTDAEAEAITNTLLKIVSEKTGYPVDMLDVNMELEADMGIDSIKQVEIIGAMRDLYPQIELDADTLDETWGNLRTLAQVSDYIKNLIASADAISGIARQEVKKKFLSPPDLGSLKIPPGHIWLITECGSGLGRALATRLEKQGQKSVVLQFPGLFSLASITGGKEIDMMTLNTTAEDHLERTLKNIESQFGTIAGLIHAHPLPQVAVSMDDFFPAAEMELVQVVYFLAKHLKTSLNQGYFVVVTQVDGQLATSRQQAYSVMGSGLSGLVKSFQRESINTHCRFLDLDPGLDMDDAVSIVLEEIADPDKSSIEVGRIRKQRLTLGLETTETSLSPLEKPDAKSVFLVSGGGRGITADCVIELAKAYGCKFILLGRTLLSASEPLWAEGCTEPDALRQNLIKDLKRKGENLTPVEINKMLSSLSSQREIRHTLEEVKGAGGEAVYQCVDITDKASLQGILSPIIQSRGHITGVIHGAGNLADKRLEKKTLADWQRVVTPKIIGLQNLLSVLDVARLKYLILFSSVSAYFGNAGQTDYALANEILNKFAYSCQSLYPGLQVTSINWGPWEKGMMNSVLQKYYQAQGIELISVATGTRLLREELEIGQTHRSQQILISGSLSLPDNYYTRRQEESSYLRDLQAVYNPFLNDHKVGDELVLPLTCAINWMVKNCENQLPNYQARVIEDFQVLKGIRLAKSFQCSCVSSVKPIDKRDDYLGYELQINTLNQDKPIAFPRYKGKIFLSNHWENLPLYNNLELQVSLDKRVEKLYGDRACLFHGKTFQGVRQVLRINEGKITSLCCLDDVARDEQGQFAVNSFNPYVADVQLHNVLIWTYVYLEQGCLPMGVEKIEQFQPLNFDQEFYVSTEIVMRNQFKVVVDIYAHDQQGQIYMKWSRVSYTLMNKLSTLFWDKEVKAV